MKLITKTHDYYDGVIGSTASDKTFVFTRERKEFLLPLRNEVRILWEEHKDLKNEYLFEGGIIGFCGGLYPYIKVTETGLSPYSLNNIEYYYNIDTLLRDYPGIAKIKKSTWSTRISLERMKDWFDVGKVTSGWSNFYEASKDPLLKSLFLKHRIAYFVIQGKRLNKELTIESYPVLREFKFFRVFDSFSTFQEIEHYLTNELVRPDKVDIIIPDKLKAQSKGFDKWSFRKMPEK
jgi:hypothetical protein